MQFCSGELPHQTAAILKGCFQNGVCFFDRKQRLLACGLGVMLLINVRVLKETFRS